MQVPVLSAWGTLGKLLNPSVPQYPPKENGDDDNKSISFTGWLQGLHELLRMHLNYTWYIISVIQIFTITF